MGVINTTPDSFSDGGGAFGNSGRNSSYIELMAAFFSASDCPWTAGLLVPHPAVDANSADSVMAANMEEMDEF